MKTFVLDTNVLLHDPACLKVFGNNEVIIPLSVLDELDNIKTRLDELGRNARQVIRLLDDIRKGSETSLSEGIRYDRSIIKVELNHKNRIPEGWSAEKVDNRIISVAIGLVAEGKEVMVVSKDINLRVKCDALGIRAEDYEKDKLAEKPDSIYSGVQTASVNPEVINELYANKVVKLEEIQAYRNQFFIFKSNINESQSAIARYIGNDTFMLLRENKAIWGITPRNAEQKMAMDLLLDPNIKLVSLIGKAGSGKTMLAVLAGLQGVISNKTYQRMLISRPIQPMGRELGFLPGTIEEKLDPWMQPIYDNLELLLGGDYQMLNMYKDDGLIQVEPLTYIRGRSIPRSYMLLDESQNVSSHEIKTIITRMGENSKIVLTGDIEQIDNPYVDFADNGLTHVVERFKNYGIAGHVTLRKGERSELATLASEIL